jgi:transaldolase
MSTNLHRLAELGQSPWIDFLSRPFVRDGELARWVEQGVAGLTSNPTIFAKALAEGEAYDEQLAELARDGQDTETIFTELASVDVREACDVLRDVFERTERRDGWVSLEVDPRLAHDADGTVAQAVELHAKVDRPNLLIKIPATVEGLDAIRRVIGRGIPVNVTLIFSLQRHREVIDAYLSGLEDLLEAGGDLSSVASVASFFVSRVDTEADKRLDAIGRGDLRGRLAVANARLAYQSFLDLHAGARFKRLQSHGATPQRCLWASTSAKDPAYRDVVYVEELIGPQTVDTMPVETAEAFNDHGAVEATLPGDVAAARRVFEDLVQAGVDIDDVTATLEREGVQKFADSFAELTRTIEQQAAAVRA